MTDTQFVFEPLDKCPVCGSEDLGYGDFIRGNNEGWMERWCNNDECGKVWYEVYTFKVSEVPAYEKEL